MGSGKGKTRRVQVTHSTTGKVTRKGTFKEKQYAWSSDYRDVKYRFKNGIWEVERQVSVDKPFLDDLGEWIKNLQENTVDLAEATIDLWNGYDGYDGVERPEITVSGWRTANTEEIQAIKKSRAKDKLLA